MLSPSALSEVGKNVRSPKTQINPPPSSWGRRITCLLLIWFDLNFRHILELIRHVAADVSQVKHITKNANNQMKESFNKAEGKRI